MSRFNTSTSHPIIPNAQQYMLHYKYVSIHSEDRDILKWPNPSEFEIESRTIGLEHPTYFIADIAANHDGDLKRAIDLV